MSLFDFFFGKRPVREAGGARRAADDGAEGRIEPGAGLPAPARTAPNGAPQGAEERRLRRHARREQLYAALRESMTRSGVLAATYKFKVLSLDQPGNEFLVMVDLSMDFEGITGQLGAMEALIIQHARARFGITVPTVYWRMDTSSAAVPPAAMPQVLAPIRPVDARQIETPIAPVTTPTAEVAAAAQPDRPIRAAMRRDPLEADEVAAFRQALLAASARAPLNAIDPGLKTRRKVSSYTLLTGFEDTELPESATSPALSKTQYGDLT